MFTRWRKSRAAKTGRAVAKTPSIEVAPSGLLIETITQPLSERRQRIALLIKILMWGGGILCSYLIYRWVRERLSNGKKYLWDNVRTLLIFITRLTNDISFWAVGGR